MHGQRQGFLASTNGQSFRVRFMLLDGTSALEDFSTLPTLKLTKRLGA